MANIKQCIDEFQATLVTARLDVTKNELCDGSEVQIVLCSRDEISVIGNVSLRKGRNGTRLIDVTANVRWTAPERQMALLRSLMPLQPGDPPPTPEIILLRNGIHPLISIDFHFADPHRMWRGSKTITPDNFQSIDAWFYDIFMFLTKTITPKFKFLCDKDRLSDEVVRPFHETGLHILPQCVAGILKCAGKYDALSEWISECKRGRHGGTNRYLEYYFDSLQNL